MISVWLVERGEYSDYRVEAIFATEAQAAEFSRHLPESSVREWALNTWTEDQASFTVRFNMSGGITEITETAFIDPVFVDKPGGNRYQKDEITVRVNRGPRDHAIKIASEYFTKIRAHLDEATERSDRALMGTSDHLRVTVSLMVAEVLAGIAPLPDPPLSGFDEMARKALGK